MIARNRRIFYSTLSFQSPKAEQQRTKVRSVQHQFVSKGLREVGGAREVEGVPEALRPESCALPGPSGMVAAESMHRGAEPISRTSVYINGNNLILKTLEFARLVLTAMMWYLSSRCLTKYHRLDIL